MPLVIGHSQVRYFSEYLDPEEYAVFSYPGYRTWQFMEEDVLKYVLPFHSGFLPKVTLKKTGIKRKAKNDLPRKSKWFAVETDHSSRGSIVGVRRRSARLLGEIPSETELEDDWENNEEENERTPKPVKRPMSYGAIEGVEVGASWETRMECSKDGIHRPTVAGIHGGPEGAYSIALSGGYDDNIDLGDCFTYTGEGGRDLKGTKNNPKNLRTAAQSKDQCLSRGNLALSKSVETGMPVRVIRGYKLTSAFAPDEGYRYDGLYNVKKAWYTTGVSGFRVWKFALRRLQDQVAPPWLIGELDNGENGSPNKQHITQDDNSSAKIHSDDQEDDEENVDIDKADSNDNDTDEDGTNEDSSRMETDDKENVTDRDDTDKDADLMKTAKKGNTLKIESMNEVVNTAENKSIEDSNDIYKAIVPEEKEEKENIEDKKGLKEQDELEVANQENLNEQLDVEDQVKGKQKDAKEMERERRKENILSSAKENL